MACYLKIIKLPKDDIYVRQNLQIKFGVVLEIAWTEVFKQNFGLTKFGSKKIWVKMFFGRNKIGVEIVFGRKKIPSFFLQESSSWDELRLHTENQLPRYCRSS